MYFYFIVLFYCIFIYFHGKMEKKNGRITLATPFTLSQNNPAASRLRTYGNAYYCSVAAAIYDL